MVDCPRTDIRDALPDLVHDQLEPIARARVEQHVSGCAECAAELGVLRSLRSSVFAAPVFDARRVADAVHAAMAETRARDIVPISAPRAERSAPPRRPGVPRHHAWHEWRAAAGIAAVAVGIAGYALSRGATQGRAPAMERAAATSSVPAPAAAGKAMAADVAGGVDAPPASTLILGDGVSDLSESDMQTLLQAVDDLEAMPDPDPRPLPLLARVVEGAL